MKSLRILMFVAFVATIESTGQTVLAQSSGPAAEARDYLLARPGLFMRYHVHTGRLADKIVEFIGQEEKFAFKWIDPETHQIVKMFTYDGHRCYSFIGFGRLEISMSVTNDPTVTSSWFVYNPLYNPFSIICRRAGQAFDASGLLAPTALEAITRIASQRMGDISRFDNGKGGVATYKYSSGCPFPTEVNVSYVNGQKVSWITKSLYPISVPGKSPYIIASEISLIDVDGAGRIDPTSYTIRLDKDSVRVVNETLNEDMFRVPMSLVENVVDADTGVVLKSSDWRTN